jgi:hypothetical protein
VPIGGDVLAENLGEASHRGGVDRDGAVGVLGEEPHA